MDTSFHPLLRPSRRGLLQSFALAGLAGVGLNALRSVAAFAADAAGWPVEAFKQKSEAEALKALFGKTAEPLTRSSLRPPRSPRTERLCRSASARRCRT